MKMRKTCAAALALVLTVAAALPSASDGFVADAAKKPALSPKKVNVKVGKSKKIKVKNYKKKVAWKTDKAAVVKLSAKKKTSVKVTGKKQGSAKVIATYKQGSKSKKLVCKVTVTANTPSQGDVQPQPQQNNNVPAPTVDPNATPAPTPTFDYDAYSECLWKKPAGKKIKDLYSDYFKVGVSTGIGDLRNGESAALIRYHFGSITMGNETKHESIVTNDIADEYPNGYGAANVENYYKGDGKVILDYDNIEKVLSYCKANGLKVRYHALVWHSQVREYFFLQDYNYDDYQLSDYEANGWDTSNYHKLADKETMKKRLNDYISQVIEYIYSHGYGDVVYAYDVINEANNGSIIYYVDENATSASQVLSQDSSKGNRFTTNPGVTTSNGRQVNSSSSPEDVMDMLTHEGRTPDASHSYWYATMGADYLYLSYLYAHDAVEKYYNQYKDQFGYTEKPSLIYNDYNQKETEQINLVKYVNLACNLEKGTSGVKYCDGIGLQSHVIPESTQDRMIKSIADAGLEVQITELDESTTGDVQASKLKRQYEIYKKYSKNGDYGKEQGADYIGVTSVTNWGLRDGDGGGWGGHTYLFEPYDDGLEEPILTYAPKPAFYGILQAGGVSAAECGTDIYGKEIPEY